MNLFKKAWQFFIFLTIISGLLVFKDQIHDITTPREKLWKERTYLNGIKIPATIIDEGQDITITFGSSGGLTEKYSIQQLKDTIGFNNRMPLVRLAGGESPFNLKFLIKDERLYIATTFKDFDGKYVGKMNFDEWELKSTKISNYHDGDNNMEIIDDNGYVLFNMQYRAPNTIVLNGYYMSGNNAIQIADDSSISTYFLDDPYYRFKALESIRKIKPLNKY